MKFLIDMNLSPVWLDAFTAEGWEAIHWSTVGEHRATDEVIMKWARDNACVIVTHDLDFSALLAATRAIGPSVIHVRTQNVLPDALRIVLINAINQFHRELEEGALISIDIHRARARVLPFE
jgi:predicted nuclease of predicted toxin-antitoxin system